ncbi:TPA: tripartite tricarboxylate transporter TctB family protein [Campylobacter jejuni]|uniref:tripartite tricarboxylate transporter TctB family protein n=1 Tax=Campylobacter jejuni TaxID=197 RepID=UPI00292AA7BA|nr:tripartite tricarboxylate transporter TctB family protein [Campylobacter jejuni]HEB8260834.1 tripartite tricarboxylate transporter TctB family protein [Campylobacter jejuni]
MLSTRIFAVFLLLISAFLLYNGWQITTEYNYEPLGPRPFPVASLILIMLCCVLLLFFAENTRVQWGDFSFWKKLIILILSLSIFALIFEYVGFMLSVGFLVFIMSVLYGAKPYLAMLFALFCGIAFYYFFENLLQITLPFGLIFE